MGQIPPTMTPIIRNSYGASDIVTVNIKKQSSLAPGMASNVLKNLGVEVGHYDCNLGEFVGCKLDKNILPTIVADGFTHNYKDAMMPSPNADRSSYSSINYSGTSFPGYF